MHTAAVLPVKRFARAKQRLSASVADVLRRELAQAMVADVLAALAQTEGIEQTIIITSERAVTRAAREQGAIVLDDEAESGQSAAAMLGVRYAISKGIERVLCVPGDCPTLDPRELQALLDASTGERGVVIVPDRHGTGTNGLLLSPPGAIPPAFGPGSCERHRTLALAAGVACRVEHVPSLLLDIDTGADLDALRERVAAHRARAPRTRAVLGQGEPQHILPITTTA